MRYLFALDRIGRSFEDNIVVEFGPGSSFGLGFAALICGAKSYYAFDLKDHTDPKRNLQVFDELVQLFQPRSPIPADGFCARIFPLIENEEFPSAILSDEFLRTCLNRDRLEELRDDILNRRGRYLRPKSTADIHNATPEEPANIIFSESVLEHVDDLESTYSFFARALASDGVMIHLIDYTCHNLANDWNGHWACSPRLWSIVRGKREFLINRKPHQYHVDLLAKNGMRVVQTLRLPRVDGITRENFAPEFQSMSRIDAVTALTQLLVARDGPQS